MNNEEIKKKLDVYLKEKGIPKEEFTKFVIHGDFGTIFLHDLITEFATQLLSQPTQGEGVCTCKDGNIIKSDNGVYWCQTCGKYPVIMATQTPDELREEFERETNGLNWNLGGTWRFYAEWLEQKLTGKEDKVCPKVSQCTNVDVSCDCPDNVICPIIIE